MLKALQTQLTSGPLADLQAGTVNGDGFVTEVQGLVGSYAQNVNQQLLPHFVNIDQLLLLQGQRIVADAVALNQENYVGLIDDATAGHGGPDGDQFADRRSDLLARHARERLCLGDSVLRDRAQVGRDGPGIIDQLRSRTADANLTVQALAEAYRANLHAGLQVTHPNISNEADTAITTSRTRRAAIDLDRVGRPGRTDHGHHGLRHGVLDTTGLFGPQGTVSRVNAEYGYVPHNLTAQRSDTTMSSVSGTGTSGGTATLTATLTSASTGTGIADAIVSFTLDGAFAGIALTD